MCAKSARCCGIALHVTSCLVFVFGIVRWGCPTSRLAGGCGACKLVQTCSVLVGVVPVQSHSFCFCCEFCQVFFFKQE